MADENRTAVIETSKGTIKVALDEKRAPITTANFIKLAESGFYDGLIFHRVIKGFMIQGGDPQGTGMGGAQETINLEIHPELRHDDGAISMARSQNPNSASSQFFICDGAQAFLDNNYATFGQTVEGIDVVRAIAAVATVANDRPVETVTMTKVTIEQITRTTYEPTIPAGPSVVGGALSPRCVLTAQAVSLRVPSRQAAHSAPLLLWVDIPRHS